MLILSRRQSQNVIIGDNIEVRVIDVNGRYVKLGFTAPDNVPIHREEIYLQIKEAAVDDSQ